MPSKGRKRALYPPEFRRQMVDLVRARRTPEELEREFEPTAQTIRNWVAQLAGTRAGEGGQDAVRSYSLNPNRHLSTKPGQAHPHHFWRRLTQWRTNCSNSSQFIFRETVSSSYE